MGINCNGFLLGNEIVVISATISAVVFSGYGKMPFSIGLPREENRLAHKAYCSHLSLPVRADSYRPEFDRVHSLVKLQYRLEQGLDLLLLVVYRDSCNLICDIGFVFVWDC
jgi:hypothetical protein